MTLDKLIAQLSHFKQELEKTDYIHEKQKFFKLTMELRKFISSVQDDNICDLFFHTKFYIDNKDFFNSVNIYFERALEASETLAIISKGQEGISGLMDIMDADFIKEDYVRKGNDIKDLDISEDKTLVMVGCGPMPETMLYLYENTPIKKIIGLDYNYEAVYLAGEIVRFLGFTDINLIYKDGCTFDYSDADIVYIPSFVNSKGEVLNQVAKTGKKDVQILARNPLKLNKLIYSALPIELNPQLKIVSKNNSFGIYDNVEMLKFEKYNI